MGAWKGVAVQYEWAFTNSLTFLVVFWVYFIIYVACEKSIFVRLNNVDRQGIYYLCCCAL